MSYINNEYEVEVSKEKLVSVINVIAQDRKYHPVVEHLECLPGWDEKHHVENLLSDWLGAERTELNTALMRLWMLGAVARAYEPGCKFDYMLVLIGAQGIGKSYFFSKLAMMPQCFTDSFSTFEGDKACEKVRGQWLIEVAELTAMRRAKDVEAIKSFITSRWDNYRKPYGRITEKRPRGCVFAGTTNDVQFLVDRTGNRRFLPIEVHKENIKHDMFKEDELFTHEIEQAWAEVLHLYKTQHPNLVLSQEQNEVLEGVRIIYTEDDYRVGMIQQYLEDNAITRVCATELWEKALRQGDKQPNKRDVKEINDIMRGLGGWKEIGRQRTQNYGIQNCFEAVRFETAIETNSAGFEELDGANEFPF